MPWTITSPNYAGVDIATIGITGLRFTLQNGLKDTCSFVMPVDAVNDASPPFAEKDSFTLTYGGTVHFRGYVERCSPEAMGDSEMWRVEIAGNGQLLDVCPYTQTLPIAGSWSATADAGTDEITATNHTFSNGDLMAFSTLTGGAGLTVYTKYHVRDVSGHTFKVAATAGGSAIDITSTLTAATALKMAETSAGLVMGYNSSGTRLNLANTLADIISSSAHRHGITAGTFLSGVTVTAPLMEVTDVSVGEALRRAAAWVPDAVIYLDHSAGTLQIKKPSALTVVNRSGTADTVENTRDGRRRKVVDGVKIIWRTTTQVNGASEVTVTTDSAGTTTGPWTTIITIDLAGSNTVTQSEQCVVAELPESTGELTAAFVAEHWPEMTQLNLLVNQLATHSLTQTIDASTHQGLGGLPSTYPSYLKAGNIPPWQAGISAAQTVLTIELRPGADFANNAALQKLFTNDEKLLRLTKTFTGTDAETTTYTNLVSYSAGDAPVTGLAADWLAALNSAAPAGTLRLVDTEPILTIKPGTKITLSGDLDVTNGIVQAVTVDIDAGETLVTYGPQSRLTPHEFMELQRAGARRSPLSASPGTARTSATPASRTLKGGIGGRADSVAHKLQDTSGWFRITQTGATTVKVGPGCIHAPETNKVAKAIFGAASGNITVSNGQYIWVKVTLAVDGDKITATGLDPVNYAANANQPSDTFSGSTPDATYYCIGQIAIAANVMTITQGQWGAIPFPPIPWSAKWFAVTIDNALDKANVAAGKVYEPFSYDPVSGGTSYAFNTTAVAAASLTLLNITTQYVVLRCAYTAEHDPSDGTPLFSLFDHTQQDLTVAVGGHSVDSNAGSPVPLYGAFCRVKYMGVGSFSLVTVAAADIEPTTDIVLAEVTQASGIYTSKQRHDGGVFIFPQIRPVSEDFAW